MIQNGYSKICAKIYSFFLKNSPLTWTLQVWNNIIIYYSVFCLMTGPKPLPKLFLHIVRSKASSFKWNIIYTIYIMNHCVPEFKWPRAVWGTLVVMKNCRHLHPKDKTLTQNTNWSKLYSHHHRERLLSCVDQNKFALFKTCVEFVPVNLLSRLLFETHHVPC